MSEGPGRIRAFLDELKRRRVFRVGSVYAVVAWAVIEVSATILPILGLPETLVTLVVVLAIGGFPVALVLAWMYDLTGEGLERTDTEAEGSMLLHRAPWLRPGITAVLLLLLFSLGWVFALRVQDEPDLSDTVSIAVFPFDVRGSGSLSYLREGMPSLLSRNLNGAGMVRAVDPDAILRRLPRSGGTPSESTARRLSEDFGADVMVMGEVVESGGNVQVTARLYDLRTGDPPITVAIPGEKANQLTGVVDRLAEVLLSQQLEREGMRLASTAALTTDSLEALKAYLTGESEYRASNWTRAIASFQRAVRVDTTFALAYYRLGTAAEWAADFALVQPAAESAYLHRGRLSEHDRLLVEAFHAFTHHDPAEAERLYRTVTRRHPEDAEAWYRLGEVLYHYNPVRGRSFVASKHAFRQALEAAPGQQPIVFHLMEVALYEGDYETFRALLARAGLEGEAMLRRTAVLTLTRGDPETVERTLADLETSGDGTVFAVATGLAQYVRNLDLAVRVARILAQPTRDPSVRGTAHLLLAQLAAARGRWREATLELDRLREIHAPSARVHRALYASVPFFGVAEPELRALRDEIEEWEPGPDDAIDAYDAFLGIHNGVYPLLRHYVLGLLSARLGEDEDVTDAVAALEAVTGDDIPFARRLAAGVRMAAEVEAEPVPDVVDLPPVNASMNEVANSAFYAQALERYNLGRTHLGAGRPEPALSWLSAATEGRNEIFLLGPAAFWTGVAHEAAGRGEAAARSYTKFLDMWEGSDPGLHEWAGMARQGLARLRE